MLLLGGCTGGQGSSPVAQTSSLATPSTPVAGFSCRLPVTPWSSTQAPAGFIAFPAGTFTADPASGPTPGYYDLAIKAWLPVGRAAVAPDGRHYATTTEGVVDRNGTVVEPATLHIVDALTRQERLLTLVGVVPAPATTALFPQVAGFEATVVYLIEYGQAGTGQLYAVDAANGKSELLTEAPHPEDVERGGFWYGDAPNVQALGAPPGLLARWDLTTHVSTVWFKRTTGDVALLGLDRDGTAIVRWTTNNADGSVAAVRIYSVTSPGHERLLYAGGQPRATMKPLPAQSSGMIADTRGLWLGSDSGIFLLSRDAGLRKMSDYAGLPANGCL